MVRPPRFTLSSLFLLLLVASFTAAAGRYLYEARVSDPALGRSRLVIFVLVVPMLLLVCVQLAYRIHRWRRRG